MLATVLRVWLTKFVVEDAQTPMTLALADALEAELKRLSKGATPSRFPLASVNKSKALTLSVAHVIGTWTTEESQHFLFQLRTETEACDWTASVERRIILQSPHTIAEALSLQDRTLQSPHAFVGVPCRVTELRAAVRSCTMSNVPQLWMRSNGEWHSMSSSHTLKQPKEFAQCHTFAWIPTTTLIVALSAKAVFVGSFNETKARAKLETSVRNPSIVEIEIIPSGTILITVSNRNEDTGGITQTETSAFRIDDNDNLTPVVLSVEEALAAEEATQKRIKAQHFDFARMSCPLAARVLSPWHSQIVFEDDIVFEDKDHGTVLGLCGCASDMWIGHASGLIVHLTNGKVQREDLGRECDASVAFQSSL